MRFSAIYLFCVLLSSNVSALDCRKDIFENIYVKEFAEKFNIQNFKDFSKPNIGARGKHFHYFEKEDIVSTNLKFEQGLIGNFLISDSGTSPWSWETGTGENIYLPHLKENNLRIVGTQGSLEFPNLKLWSYKNEGDNWKNELESFNYDFDEVDPYISQINHFIDVINNCLLYTSPSPRD